MSIVLLISIALPEKTISLIKEGKGWKMSITDTLSTRYTLQGRIKLQW